VYHGELGDWKADAVSWFERNIATTQPRRDARLAALEAQWATKIRQLHGLAVSIGTERQRGNEAGVKAMRPVFVAVANDLNQLARQLQRDELTWVEHFLMRLDTGAQVVLSLPEKVVGQIKKGLAPVTWIIVLALLAVIAGSGAYVFGGRRR
jgi:hypothetical protein